MPKHEEDVLDNGDDFIDDPRQELMERLIEYKKYKQVATELKEREQEEHSYIHVRQLILHHCNKKRRQACLLMLRYMIC